MNTSRTSKDCHSTKRGVAVLAVASFLLLLVTSSFASASLSTSTKPAGPFVLAAAPMPPHLAKYRLLAPVAEPPAPTPRPAVHEVSRSTPRPQLPPLPHRTASVTPRPKPSSTPPPAQNRNRIPVGNIQAYARALVGSDTQFTCLAHIIDRESGWNPHAANPEGAYGIPQALPGAKMSSAGSDWRDNPETQIRWMLSYIANRYGTPCNAWGFWQGHSWY